MTIAVKSEQDARTAISVFSCRLANRLKNMCGIAGCVDWAAGTAAEALRAMEQSLVHRGPDEGSVWSQGPVGLAHRRLRVIDLSPAAAQPMASEDNNIHVVFNGEIYNFRSLREELCALGHTFRSRSDTEVLVHGYQRWNTDLFSRLTGMFAIGIWDDCSQRLVLARDAFGEKPLFYHASERRLIFASELPVFRCFKDLDLKLRRDAFRQFLEYGYVPSPNTILDNVQRLPPGHYAVWSERGLTLAQFWSLPFSPPSARSADTAAAAAEALLTPLREAVARRLVSDVPLGCFLSGGIDSSLVAALAQESLGTRLKTYTVGFADSAMSEASYAAAIAKHLGTDHTELIVSPSTILAEYQSILERATEPQGDDSFVPTFLVARETRGHVTVALSGDGGDEIFAGYTRYRQFQVARPLKKLPIPWRKIAPFVPADKWKKKLAALGSENSMELARWLSTLWKREELDEVLAPGLRNEPEHDLFEERWNARSAFPDIERWMLTDMETYMEGDILTKVDRASMAVGLEVRSPFLDPKLVEAVLNWECHAWPRSGGKAVLKSMLARYVPAMLFERPKQGFGMPIDDWYRGPLRKMLLSYTDRDRLLSRGLLVPRAVEAAVRAHLSGRRNFARKLHALVAFEIWADQFFGKQTPLA